MDLQFGGHGAKAAIKPGLGRQLPVFYRQGVNPMKKVWNKVLRAFKQPVIRA